MIEDEEEFKNKQRSLHPRRDRLKKNATAEELKMKELLQDLKIEFCFQKGFIWGKGYCICDFYLPDLRLCIEIDGEYHFNDKQNKIDKYKDKYLTIDRKFTVLRISNAEVRKMVCVDLSRMLKRLDKKMVNYSPQYFVE